MTNIQNTLEIQVTKIGQIERVKKFNYLVGIIQEKRPKNSKAGRKRKLAQMVRRLEEDA